jgi:poly-gamma-glutamate synthesis protein (capsule biosynthesis protein)
MLAQSAKLGFVGDLMFGRLVNQQLHRRNPEWFWGDVIGLLKEADAIFGNLECAITTSDHQWRRTAKVFHFRANPAAVSVLKAGNIRFVSLANNHAMDFEARGLLDTIRHLDEGGIAHAGAGADRARAYAPAIVQAGPLKVGLFAVTDNMHEWAATPNAPGICHVNPATGEGGPTAEDFRRLREAGADLIVVSAHLGPNMRQRPNPTLRAYKRRLAEQGADIVHGHSSHIVQGLERIGSSLVFHDAGDFVDDYAIDPELRNDLSFLFLVEASKSGIGRVRLIPVRLYVAQVRRAPPDDAAVVCERMQALSRELGVALKRTGDGLDADLSSAGGGFDHRAKSDVSYST